jgi:hypothetical protein
MAVHNLALCVKAMATKFTVHPSPFGDNTLIHGTPHPGQDNACTQSEPFQGFEIQPIQSTSKALEEESMPPLIVSTGPNVPQPHAVEGVDTADSIGGMAGPRHTSENEPGTLGNAPNGNGSNKITPLATILSDLDMYSKGPQTLVASAIITEPNDSMHLDERKGNQAKTSNKQKDPFGGQAGAGALASPFPLASSLSTRRSQRIVGRLFPRNWKLPVSPSSSAKARAGLAWHTEHQLSAKLPTLSPAALSTLTAITSKQRRTSPDYPTPVQIFVQALPASADWLCDPLVYMLRMDIGAPYHHLVSRLIQFDKLHNFETKWGTNLPSTHWLAEVGRWISSRRRNIKLGASPEVYSKQWWRWWEVLHPERSAFDKTGRPKAMAPAEVFTLPLVFRSDCSDS